MSPSSRTRRTPVTDVTGRLQRRRRRLWVQRAVAALLGLAAVVLLGGGIWLVRYSQVLASKKVVVKGTHALTPAQVEQVAQVPLGVPLVRLDLEPVNQRVLTLPQVREVTTSTSWPGTVTVTVTERTPVLTVHSPDGYRLVDADGQAYAVTPTAAKDLPVATLAGVIEPATARALATVVAQLPAELRTAAISVPSKDAITLALPGGKKKVVWGGPEQSAEKGRVLTALMKAVPAATLYDVSAPSRPVTR